MSEFGLTKDERLHSKRDIDTLIAKGRFGEIEFLKYKFLKTNGCPYNRMMVSVPKRLFKRAVKRNLLKRRIRESFRLQKHLIQLSQQGEGTDILFIYSDRNVRSFSEIKQATEKILTKING